MDTIISLDVGTSSIRATLYTVNGDYLFSSNYYNTPTFFSDGGVRQNPESWYDGMIYVLKNCVNFLSDKIFIPLAISVTTQRASIIPVDENGQALSDAILWEDKTTFKECESIQNHIDNNKVYSITGT